MSFSDLKKQSSLGNLTSKLIKEVEKQSGGGGQTTDNIWKPEMDKSGNGYAVIRFLPAPDQEDLPWVKVFSHAFQGPGGWYIENSLTTINQKDPVGELNRSLWNSGSDADKEIARKQKRKLSFYANIYVVKDPANPQNEGQVFLYKFGKKIFDKIMEAMQPEFDDETPINPFDFWQGANFKLKLKKVAGYWNYDSSEFASPSPLLDDDDALEAIWKKEQSLQDFIAPDKFKSYEELETRMNYVLGAKSTRKATVEEETEYDNYAAQETKQVSEEQVMEKLEQSYQASKETTTTVDTDDEDPMSYFAKLAES
jgi:hypothetical protein